VINHAVIVKDDFIVSQEIEYIYEGQLTVQCNAILKAFLASRQSEVEGGILFVTGCPGLTSVSLIIAAKLSKVVYNREPADSDEMCAIELLRERGIETVCNPSIIL